MSDLTVIHRQQRIIVEPASQTVAVASTGLRGPQGEQGPQGPPGPGSIGEIAFASTTASSTHGALSAVPGLSVTFNVVLGRKYKISADVRGGNASVVGVRQLAWLARVIGGNDTTVLLLADFINTAAGAFTWCSAGFYRYVPAASGSETFKVMGQGIGGTVDIMSSATSPIHILAEDIGEV